MVQTLSQGADRLLPLFVVDAAGAGCSPRGILARNDPRTRALEGLEQKVEVLAGEVPDAIAVTENGVELRRRRPARPEDRPLPRSAREPARPRRLLCARPAARLLQLPRRLRAGARRAGARRRSRSTSPKTPSRASGRTPRGNGVAIDARVGNVFDELRGLERLGERFDTIVLDPPAFAKNKAAVDQARSAGYKEINLRALKLLNPAARSSPAAVRTTSTKAMFAEIVYEAAVDAHGQRHRRREADAGRATIRCCSACPRPTI